MTDGQTDGRTDGRTDGQTHGRTNIKFWGPSTQKALKGKYGPVGCVTFRTAEFVHCRVLVHLLHLRQNFPRLLKIYLEIYYGQKKFSLEKTLNLLNNYPMILFYRFFKIVVNDVCSLGKRVTMNVELYRTKKPPKTYVFPLFSSENH